MPKPITHVLTDIGGVLLTNGWDRTGRARAAAHFGLETDEVDERHNQAFVTYEEGKLTLDEYLAWVVFFRERSFSIEDFKQFMYEQSQPFPEMLGLLRQLKRQHGLKVVVVSNEGRELTLHRIEAFQLNDLVDVFVSSSFVHYHKPDPDIFRLAIDVAMVPLDRCVYLEDRPLFVEVARSLGIPAIRHENFESTRDAFAALGLTVES